MGSRPVSCIPRERTLRLQGPRCSWDEPPRSPGVINAGAVRTLSGTKAAEPMLCNLGGTTEARLSSLYFGDEGLF